MCIIIFPNNSSMDSLSNFTQLTRQFQAQIGEEANFNEADRQFLLKPFKLKKFSLCKLITNYTQSFKKYQQGTLQPLKDDWHKNQRKMFIEFLVCFCRLSKGRPDELSEPQWSQLGQIFFQKNPMFLKFQGLSIMKSKNKISWSEQDDDLIRSNIRSLGDKNWNQVSKAVFYQTNYCKYFSPKQIRERWYNHINENVKKGNWSREEDLAILEHVLYNNKHWCQIVKDLQHTRTEHMIKNRYKFLVKPSNYKKAPKQQRILRQVIARIRRQLGLPTQIKICKTDYKSKMQIPVSRQEIYKQSIFGSGHIYPNQEGQNLCQSNNIEDKQLACQQTSSCLKTYINAGHGFITLFFPDVRQNENIEFTNCSSNFVNNLNLEYQNQNYYGTVQFPSFYYIVPGGGQSWDQNNKKELEEIPSLTNQQFFMSQHLFE